jgi:hypothetical protein
MTLRGVGKVANPQAVKQGRNSPNSWVTDRGSFESKHRRCMFDAPVPDARTDTP